MANVSQIRIEVARFRLEEAQVQEAPQRGLVKGSGPGQRPEKGSPSPSRVENEKRLLELKEERLLTKLRQVDREVRAHELAHLMAAGPYARGGPHYEFVRGPDGKFYAVAGEVKIDTSPVPGDPEATLEKARAIKRAALAPANPSPQDRMVAALADRMAAKAMMEIQKQHLEALRAAQDQHSFRSAKGTSNKEEALSRYQQVARPDLPPQLSLDIRA